MAKGPEPIAGSFFRLCNNQGTRTAIRQAQITVKNKETPKIIPMLKSPSHKKEIKASKNPSIKAITRLIFISFKRYFLYLIANLMPGF